MSKEDTPAVTGEKPISDLVWTDLFVPEDGIRLYEYQVFLPNISISLMYQCLGAPIDHLEEILATLNNMLSDVKSVGQASANQPAYVANNEDIFEQARLAYISLDYFIAVLEELSPDYRKKLCYQFSVIMRR